MNFPKGINKIIEEYCCYEVPFKLELLKKTGIILNDTIKYISYDNYFIDIKNEEKISDTRCFKIKKTQCGWTVSSE